MKMASEKGKKKINADKCQKALQSNEGAKATADDVCGAHLCGYTVSLPSTIIGTKSCSDANVWEINW